MSCPNNRVVYSTCPNSGKRIYSQTVTHSVGAPIAAGSTVHYSSRSSGGGGAAASYHSSSSSSKSYSSSSSSGHAVGGGGAGAYYHSESYRSTGGGLGGGGRVVETIETGPYHRVVHHSTGLGSAHANLAAMEAEMDMDRAMLGTARTTVIGTTGGLSHGGLTGGSYVERSSYSSSGPAYVEKSSYYSSSSSSGGRFI